MFPELYSVVSVADASKPVATFSPLNAVNFSGNTVGGVRSAFTVGGWVRRTQTGALQMLFKAPEQFQLWIDPDGYLTASMLGDAAVVRSSLPISNTEWHHVAAAFQQDPAVEASGSLTVYLDGLPDSGVVSTSHTTAQSTCTLGAAGEASGVEFASWTIWTQALLDDPFDLPPWGAPVADSPLRAGLLAVFDFAGQQITSSNQSLSITSSNFTTTRPCLKMTGPGYARLTTPTTLAVGNSGAWSLLFWVKVPRQAQAAQFIPFVNGARGGPGEHPAFTVAINVGSQQSIEVTRSFPPANPETVLTGACDVSEWSHVALTYDAQKVALYVNGSLVTTSDSITLTESFDSPSVALNPDNLPLSCLQGLSFWNRLVRPEELEALADTVPVNADGLQASFPLLTDLFDCASGLELNVLFGGALGADQTTTSNVASAYQPLRSGLDTRNPPGDGRTLVAGDYWALAQSLGISIPNRSERDATESPDLAAFYQSSYFTGIPEPARGRVIQHFDRAYRLGQTLRTRGIKAGQTEVAYENGQTVFYYNTLIGRTEIDRRDVNLSAMDAWIATIVMDVLFLMFAVAGVSVTPRAVGAAVRGRRLARLFPAISATLANVPPGVSAAMVIVGNIINLLNQAGAIVSIIWEIITFSWWDFLFTGIGVLASIIALFFAPASVGWRLANLAVALGILAFDLTQKPAEQPFVPPVDPPVTPPPVTPPGLVSLPIGPLSLVYAGLTVALTITRDPNYAGPALPEGVGAILFSFQDAGAFAGKLNLNTGDLYDVYADPTKNVLWTGKFTDQTHASGQLAIANVSRVAWTAGP